ncbi:hypothetical protein PLANPX_0688 [Lacipirellula parvula]|uniref:Uncharacterized protein n=1 Tax=Lacipirellula parvula TaxID=2650471 RepID=A0A5K7X9S1_9BACT|nr:hypothetical protein PLANPX_0688 [Lacipirellula parvula]
MCSTPVGVKGSLTQFATNRLIQQVECSTPVGVKGSLTRTIRDRFRNIPRAQRLSASKDLSRHSGGSLSLSIVCAQRLSASKDLSHCGAKLRFLPAECSTPVGVKGSLTSPAAG